nr:hypothetical protein [Streptomyces sp. MH191]
MAGGRRGRQRGRVRVPPTGPLHVQPHEGGPLHRVQDRPHGLGQAAPVRLDRRKVEALPGRVAAVVRAADPPVQLLRAEDRVRVEGRVLRHLLAPDHRGRQQRGVAVPAADHMGDGGEEPVAVGLGPVQVVDAGAAVGSGGGQGAVVRRRVEAAAASAGVRLPGRTRVRRAGAPVGALGASAGPLPRPAVAGRALLGAALAGLRLLRLAVAGLRPLRLAVVLPAVVLPAVVLHLRLLRFLRLALRRSRRSERDLPRFGCAAEPFTALLCGVQLVPAREPVGALADPGVLQCQRLGLLPCRPQHGVELVHPDTCRVPYPGHLRQGLPLHPCQPVHGVLALLLPQFGPALVRGFGGVRLVVEGAQRVACGDDLRQGVQHGDPGVQVPLGRFEGRVPRGSLVAAQVPVLLVGGRPLLVRLGDRVPRLAHLRRESGVVDQSERTGHVLAHPGQHGGVGLHRLRCPLRLPEGAAQHPYRPAVLGVVVDGGDAEPRGGDGEEEGTRGVRLDVDRAEPVAGLGEGVGLGGGVAGPRGAHLVGAGVLGGGEGAAAQGGLGGADAGRGHAGAVGVAPGCLVLHPVGDGEELGTSEVRPGVHPQVSVGAAEEAAVGQPGDLVAVGGQGVVVERGEGAVAGAVLEVLRGAAAGPGQRGVQRLGDERLAGGAGARHVERGVVRGRQGEGVGGVQVVQADDPADLEAVRGQGERFRGAVTGVHDVVPAARAHDAGDVHLVGAAGRAESRWGERIGAGAVGAAGPLGAVRAGRVGAHEAERQVLDQLADVALLDDGVPTVPRPLVPPAPEPPPERGESGRGSRRGSVGGGRFAGVGDLQGEAEPVAGDVLGVGLGGRRGGDAHPALGVGLARVLLGGTDLGVLGSGRPDDVVSGVHPLADGGADTRADGPAAALQLRLHGLAVLLELHAVSEAVEARLPVGSGAGRGAGHLDRDQFRPDPDLTFADPQLRGLRAPAADTRRHRGTGTDHLLAEGTHHARRHQPVDGVPIRLGQAERTQLAVEVPQDGRGVEGVDGKAAERVVEQPGLRRPGAPGVHRHVAPPVGEQAQPVGALLRDVPGPAVVDEDPASGGPGQPTRHVPRAGGRPADGGGGGRDLVLDVTGHQDLPVEVLAVDLRECDPGDGARLRAVQPVGADDETVGAGQAGPGAVGLQQGDLAAEERGAGADVAADGRGDTAERGLGVDGDGSGQRGQTARDQPGAVGDDCRAVEVRRLRPQSGDPPPRGRRGLVEVGGQVLALEGSHRGVVCGGALLGQQPGAAGRLLQHLLRRVGDPGVGGDGEGEEGVALVVLGSLPCGPVEEPAGGQGEVAGATGGHGQRAPVERGEGPVGEAGGDVLRGDAQQHASDDRPARVRVCARVRGAARCRGRCDQVGPRVPEDERLGAEQVQEQDAAQHAAEPPEPAPPGGEGEVVAVEVGALGADGHRLVRGARPVAALHVTAAAVPPAEGGGAGPVRAADVVGGRVAHGEQALHSPVQSAPRALLPAQVLAAGRAEPQPQVLLLPLVPPPRQPGVDPHVAQTAGGAAGVDQRQAQAVGRHRLEAARHAVVGQRVEHFEGVVEDDLVVRGVAPARVVRVQFVDRRHQVGVDPRDLAQHPLGDVLGERALPAPVGAGGGAVREGEALHARHAQGGGVVLGQVGRGGRLGPGGQVAVLAREPPGLGARHPLHRPGLEGLAARR